MKGLAYILVLSVSMVFVTCCSPKAVKQEVIQRSPEERQELLIQKNRERLKNERMAIKAYTDSSEFEFIATGSGLLYAQLELSENKGKIKEGDLVVLEYEIRLLKNEILESSKTHGVKEVRFLSDDEILGLHEGLALMHLQDEYLFIVPAHLAFGISGDLNIPTNATLVYKVKIVSIN